jgi:hypothetical protein
MVKISEEVDLETLVREHESRKRTLAAFAVPILLVCPSIANDTLTVPHTQPPRSLPCIKINAADESCVRPEADHPVHGEGSGELPIFSGIGASGALTNTTNAILISPPWEPPSSDHHAFDIFRGRPASQMLHVGPVTPRRPFLPRARSGLKS